MGLIWCCTYTRIESALKLIIVSDTVQRRRFEKPARFNSDGLSALPCEKVRAQRGGDIDLEGPSARGQFPIFGTVGKTGLPPTESQAKTLRTVGFIVLVVLQWQVGEGLHP